MQARSPLLDQLDLFADRPTVGALMALCEENYGALRRLAPSLPTLGGRLLSRCPGQTDLLLEIVDQAPYTTTLRLTHQFQPPVAEPNALLRAYHDAGQVEVLNLRQTVLPLFTHYQSPALDAKWRANLFIAKWLGYCLREGHRFPPANLRPRRLATQLLLTSP